jgi:uncharacterized metal-binding protein YceD (DUF177 family)
MSHTPFKIDLRNLPEEGKDLAGTLAPAFFEHSATHDINAVSPLHYDLHVERDSRDVLVSGRLEAGFELVCGRCLQKFGQRVELDDYQTEISIEDPDATIDLTEAVREDILLALPSYPRCENGNVEPRECPAQGKFEPVTDDSAPGEPAEPQARDVWKVLDQLKKR